MAVKNLSQLKKALASGTPFEITAHYMHPDYAGQVRVVQVMQTNGMYTGMYNDKAARINTLNGGKGLWCSFGKASDWSFDGEKISLSLRGRPIMDIKLIKKEA